MKTPTIGYENDTTLYRSEVARVQLVEAIALFVDTKFLAALTLAGAAEEILGKLVVRQAKLPVIREAAQAIARLRDATGLFIMEGKPEKELIDGWNAGRNTAKHLVAPEEDMVTLNLCDEAYWMIGRALQNATNLHICIENQNEFDNWFIINVAT